MIKESHGRRGRPRAFDRTQALKAATRLFWIKGYEVDQERHAELALQALWQAIV